jgi:hypothetical protein
VSRQPLPVTLFGRSAPALHDVTSFGAGRRRRVGCAARNSKSEAIARSILSVFTSVCSCWPTARAAFFQATAAVSGAGVSNCCAIAWRQFARIAQRSSGLCGDGHCLRADRVSERTKSRSPFPSALSSIPGSKRPRARRLSARPADACFSKVMVSPLSRPGCTCSISTRDGRPRMAALAICFRSFLERPAMAEN